MEWLCTGDTHGYLELHRRLQRIESGQGAVRLGERALIILGDAGLNFCLDESEVESKKRLSKFNTYIYCVRGNHEARPESLGYEKIFDKKVDGEVYIDGANSLIRYFIDGGIYTINGYKVLVIGGAYSVDKWYRLERAKILNCASGWFENEQLSLEEMREIESRVRGQCFDFVFSHSCPISWQPTDLFLNGVDQSAVDKSMEIWLDELKDKITWGYWCFGHYHADRCERPHVEMFYQDFDDLTSIAERWHTFDSTGELDWWIECAPNFDKEMDKNE